MKFLLLSQRPPAPRNAWDPSTVTQELHQRLLQALSLNGFLLELHPDSTPRSVPDSSDTKDGPPKHISGVFSSPRGRRAAAGGLSRTSGNPEFNRLRELIMETDVVVADVTYPTFSLGSQLTLAILARRLVLLLHLEMVRPPTDTIFLPNPLVDVHTYNYHTNFAKLLSDYLNRRFDKAGVTELPRTRRAAK